MSFSRACHRVDEYVSGLVVAYLEQFNVDDQPVDVAGPQVTEVARLEERLNKLRAKWEDGEVDDEDFFPSQKKLRSTIKGLREHMAEARRRDALHSMAGSDARGLWEEASLGERRAVIAQLFEAVTMKRTEITWRFDPQAIEVLWRR